MKKIFAGIMAAIVYAATLPVAVPVAAVASIGLTGCTMTLQQKEALVNAVVSAAGQIVAQAEPGATWVPAMESAITALKNSEAGWVDGGTAQNIIAALNTISAIAAVVPVTAPYAGLIAVLVAAVDAILAVLPASTNQALMAVTIPNGPYYNYHGRAKIAHPFYRGMNAGDIENAWVKAGGKPLK